MTRSYYRIMLGRKSMHAKECYEGQFIGGGWGINTDLSGKLSEDWRQFNAAFIPVYMENHPDKSTLQADLAILKKMQGGNTITLINLGKQLSSSLQNLIKSLYGALGYIQAGQEARAFASA